MTKSCKRIDCELNCKATAACNNNAMEDLDKEDKSLAELLKEQGLDDEIKDNSISSS